MVVVRRAVAADGAALARIDLATWGPLTSPSPPPADPASYRFFGERTRPEDVLVAEVGGGVAGYVKVQPAAPLASCAHVLEVGGLAVAPRHQGAGVGRLLLEAAVDEARRRGGRRLRLRVLGPNAAARRLYDACGFVVEGVLREEFLLEGRYVDDVLMARDLAAGGGAAGPPAR